MESLEIFTFGGLRIFLGGVPLSDFHSRKAEALLVYLAVMQRPQPREALAELLWPERPAPQSFSNLRVIVSNLRARLAPYLHITRDQVGFNWDSPLTCDTLALEAALAQQDLAAALQVYQGEFLAGFSLAGAPAFEAWVLETRALYHQKALTVLQQRIDHALLYSDYAAALQSARRWVSLDALDESAHLALMRLLASGGQRSAALAQFETCRRLLSDQLRIAPGAEITAFYNQLKAENWSAGEASGSLSSSVGADVLPAAPPLPAFLDARRLPLIPEAARFTAAEPFVGREVELDWLAERLARMLEGQGGIAFVLGEVGSGKTCLLREFARRAQAAYRRLLVAGGACHFYRGDGEPLLPFRELLARLTGDLEQPWLAGALSYQQALTLWDGLPLTVEALLEHAPDLPGSLIPIKALLSRLDDPGLQARAIRLTAGRKENRSVEPGLLFRQAADFLGAVAARRPLLILLEDLHWADPASVDLLSFLVPRLQGQRILILAACRAEEMRQSPLQALLTEFKRQFGGICLDLDRLNDAAGLHFVERLLDVEPNDLGMGFRQRFLRQTGGHPLFAVELLREMQVHCQLERDSTGRWVEGACLGWDAVPARVEAIIEMRVARLPALVYEALKVASVEGETFTLEVVARLLGVDSDQLLQEFSASPLKEARLFLDAGVRWLGRQRLALYRFRHLFYQRYFEQLLGEAERASLHEKVGLALEALYRDAPEELAALAPRLAHHFRMAGNALKAGHYLLQLGNRAARLGFHDEAIDHFKQGLALLQALPRSAARLEQEIALSLALCVPLQARRGYADPEVQRLHAHLRQLCEQGDTDHRRDTEPRCDEQNPLYPALYFLRIAHKSPEERDVAQQRAGNILAAGEAQDPLLLSLAHWTLGAELSYAGNLLPARVHLEQVGQLYAPQEYPWCAFLFGNDPGIASRARLSWVLWLLGYPEQAARCSQEALRMAEMLDHSTVLGFAIGIAGVLFHQLRGDVLAVALWNQRSRQLSAKDQVALFQPAETLLHGWVLAQDEQPGGIEMMERGLNAWRQSGAFRHYPHYLGMLAGAYAAAGAPGRGLACIEEALAALAQSGERYYEAELYRLQGELLCQAQPGAADERAEAAFRQAIAVACSQQAKAWELRAALSLSRFLAQRGQREPARQTLHEIYAWFSEGWADPDLVQARALLRDLE